MTKPLHITYLTAFTLFFSLTVGAQNSSVKIEKDPQIDALLKLKKEINSDDTSSKNYRIQIYSGDMSGAKNAESKYKSTYKEWKSSLVYEPPNYKIWVGNYRTSLEADRAIKTIKKTFDGAFIFKPKKERK